MITLTMPAKEFPSGTVVRKPTGTMRLRVEHEIKIYAESGTQVIPANDGVFLVSDGGINLVDGEKKLSMDFPYLEEAHHWIERHFPEEIFGGD
ncbi:MAG: hypothetical protein ACYSW8_26970 [Planctomycetota bacterium]|jgi:hypothetical protein